MQRLVKSHVQPLTLWMELQDILPFLTLLKNSPDNFNLCDYVCFNTNSTHSSSNNKPVPTSSCIPQLNSATKHFYFYQIVRVWNSLHPFDIHNFIRCLKIYFQHCIGNILSTIITLMFHVLGIKYVPVVNVHQFRLQNFEIILFQHILVFFLGNSKSWYCLSMLCSPLPYTFVFSLISISNSLNGHCKVVVIILLLLLCHIKHFLLVLLLIKTLLRRTKD